MANYKSNPENEKKVKTIEDQYGLNDVKSREDLENQDRDNDMQVHKFLNGSKSDNRKPNETFAQKKRQQVEGEDKTLEEKKREEKRKMMEQQRQMQGAGVGAGRGGRRGAAPPTREIDEIPSFADCISDEERVLYIQHHLKEEIERKHHDEDDALGRYNGYFYSSWGELVLNDDLQGDNDK